MSKPKSVEDLVVGLAKYLTSVEDKSPIETMHEDWAEIAKFKTKLHDLLVSEAVEYAIDAEYKYRSKDGVHQLVAEVEKAIPLEAINRLFNQSNGKDEK